MKRPRSSVTLVALSIGSIAPALMTLPIAAGAADQTFGVDNGDVVARRDAGARGRAG